jgi:hypothetical protein
MIRHVVALRWNDSVSDADLQTLSAAATELPAAIPAIAEYRHGHDLGLADTNFDFAIVADFASLDDYVTYRDHPAHHQFIADHIAGRAAERVAVQFEF